jgi:hypothetical protein
MFFVISPPDEFLLPLFDEIGWLLRKRMAVALSSLAFEAILIKLKIFKEHVLLVLGSLQILFYLLLQLYRNHLFLLHLPILSRSLLVGCLILQLEEHFFHHCVYCKKLDLTTGHS